LLVYLTGRTVTDVGARGIAVRVDHRDDAAVAALFERVAAERGRLDLLVNNAAVIHDKLTSRNRSGTSHLNWAMCSTLGCVRRMSHRGTLRS